MIILMLENNKHMLHLLFNSYVSNPAHFFNAYQQHCRLYLDEYPEACFNKEIERSDECLETI